MQRDSSFYCLNLLRDTWQMLRWKWWQTSLFHVLVWCVHSLHITNQNTTELDWNTNSINITFVEGIAKVALYLRQAVNSSQIVRDKNSRKLRDVYIWQGFLRYNDTEAASVLYGGRYSRTIDGTRRKVEIGSRITEEETHLMCLRLMSATSSEQSWILETSRPNVSWLTTTVTPYRCWRLPGRWRRSVRSLVGSTVKPSIQRTILGHGSVVI